MTQVLEDNTVHLSNLAVAMRHAPADQPWLNKLRRESLACLDANGFPTTRDEEWRFTNVSPIVRTRFELASPQDTDAGRQAVREYSFGEDASCELVLVNGHFAPKLSRVNRELPGIAVLSMAEALQKKPALIEQHLGRYATFDGNPFVALNNAMFRDGIVVHLGRGAMLKAPIHLLFVGSGGQRPVAAHPRVLVVAEDDAHASIVESYVGGGAGIYFTNAVTEIVAGDRTHLDHCRLQQEAASAYHVSFMRVQVGCDSRFISHAATIGGKLTRNDLQVMMNGQRSSATLNGLVLAGGEQHVDNHTLLHHEKANCPSHELYKHVLDGRATVIFKGKIFVQKDAQKTDSKQTSKSLLLSDDAMMESMPALEIYADDVKCTHGSTTGPVDEDMVFYLRSRGVGTQAARHLLTYAFAADITRRIKIEPVRRRIEDFMAAQHGLPQDLRITDLGEHDEAAL